MHLPFIALSIVMFCGTNNPNKKELTPQEQTNQEWDAMAGEWDDLAVGYSNSFYDWLKQNSYLPKTNSECAILDFGCGTGLLTNLLRPHAKDIWAIDASNKMIVALQEKIRSSEWNNVEAQCLILANPQETDVLETKQEQYDMIVASSVLTFIPKDDREATLVRLGSFLKPGGLLIHSDWPKSEAKHPDAMDEATAVQFYNYAGLKAESMTVTNFDMGGGQAVEVFVGVARKPTAKTP